MIIKVENLKQPLLIGGRIEKFTIDRFEAEGTVQDILRLLKELKVGKIREINAKK